jgi:hypothetical protein
MVGGGWGRGCKATCQICTGSYHPHPSPPPSRGREFGSWITCPGAGKLAHIQKASILKERLGGTGVLTCAGGRLEPRGSILSFSDVTILAKSLPNTIGN